MSLSQKPSPALLRIMETRGEELVAQITNRKNGGMRVFIDAGLLVDTLLAGRYHVHGAIGTGGLSTVFSATDRKFGRRVAIKILDPGLIIPEAPDRNPGNNIFRMFVAESAILTYLQHPNIVSGFGLASFSEGLLFFPMEYLDGHNLSSAIYSDFIIRWWRAKKLLLEICDALIELHKLGVINRDIKPGNVHLCNGTEGGETAKMFDLGLSIYVHGYVPKRTRYMPIGSDIYMAPEQREAPDFVDFRADIYSLGIVMYEMLTGHLPVWSRQNTGDRYLTLLDNILPESARNIIVRTVSKEPQNRFASVQEMRDAILECDY